jgi:pimeloyl-ACP methyl ester carboxylesterase
MRNERTANPHAVIVVNIVLNFLRFLVFGTPKRDTHPHRIDFRSETQHAAIILVHGFSGATGATWGNLPTYLMADSQIRTWDIYGLGFHSGLRVDVTLWEAEPDIEILAKQLATTLSLGPFNRYQAIAIAAHSMGGLVVQRAVLDDPSLAARLTHLFLFGTPTGGVVAARLLSKIKRQFRDMSPSSPFIRNLKTDWKATFPQKHPFDLRVIAGDLDVFVPPASSLVPFPESTHAVVSGNHLEIVKPTNPAHPTVRLIVESLTGRFRSIPPVDSARLAVELGHFKKAISTLLPNVETLDDNALVILALALEGADRGNEALSILESHYHGGKSLDALGALAGRLKRRWLSTRNAVDFSRSKELYEEGFRKAVAAGDRDQSYYHAINVAFLEMMDLAPASAMTDRVQHFAQQALDHCEQATPNQWRSATKGEALLILGRAEPGYLAYSDAIAQTSSQREIDSMYAQAFRVAERVYGDSGLIRIQQIFGYQEPRSQAD